jgi:hypothetical protein
MRDDMPDKPLGELPVKVARAFYDAKGKRYMLRCELPAEPDSEHCHRHQNLGRGEQHDPVDPELMRYRQKLARIEALVVNYERVDPYNGVATLRKIREVIDG